MFMKSTPAYAWSHILISTKCL